MHPLYTTLPFSMQIKSYEPRSANPSANATGGSSGASSATASVDGGDTSSSSTATNLAAPGGFRLVLRATLCGHTEAVTCVAASNAFNLVLSGSRDGTCIMWDSSRLCFLRQLPDHAAPVTAVSISEATGDIATCSGSYLYVWSSSGERLAAIDTAGGRGKAVLCIGMSTVSLPPGGWIHGPNRDAFGLVICGESLFTSPLGQMYDWDPENVILTGSSDGLVHMWGLGYRQADGDEANQSSSTTDQASPIVMESYTVENRRLSLVDEVGVPSIDVARCLMDFCSSRVSDVF